MHIFIGSRIRPAELERMFGGVNALQFELFVSPMLDLFDRVGGREGVRFALAIEIHRHLDPAAPVAMDAMTMADARFIQTRSSVRHYTGEPVAPELIENAVRIAIKSPKVCNREMRRVRVAYAPELRNHLLSYHNGNRGFGHKMGAVMVVVMPGGGGRMGPITPSG